MTDRPLARFHEGRLEMDYGGVYYPATRFDVVMTVHMFLSRSDENAKRYVRDCRRALAEYDKAKEEAE
jgi:hypothetical protein